MASYSALLQKAEQARAEAKLRDLPVIAFDSILYAITEPGDPTELVETGRGQVAYSQWLEEELARIRRKGNWTDASGLVPVAIYTDPKTREISLVHLRVKLAA